MNRGFIIFLFLLFSQELSAQIFWNKKYEYLENANNQFENKEYNKSLEFIEKYMDSDNGKNKYVTAKAKILKGRCYYYLNKEDSLVISLFEDAIELVEKESRQEQAQIYSIAYLKIGILYNLRGKYSDAVEFLEYAQENNFYVSPNKLGLDQEVKICEYLIDSYHNLGRYDKALDLCNKGIEISNFYQEEKDSIKYSFYPDLIENLRDLNKYEEAIEVQNELLKYNHNINNTSQIINGIFWLALLNDDLGFIQKSDSLYLKCAELAKENKDTSTLYSVYRNRAFQNLEDTTNLSLQLYDSAYYFAQSKNFKKEINVLLANQAIYLIHINENQRAGSKLSKITFPLEKDQDSKSFIYKTFANFYEKENKIDSAYFYLKKVEEAKTDDASRKSSQNHEIQNENVDGEEDFWREQGLRFDYNLSTYEKVAKVMFPISFFGCLLLTFFLFKERIMSNEFLRRFMQVQERKKNQDGGTQSVNEVIEEKGEILENKKMVFFAKNGLNVDEENIIYLQTDGSGGTNVFLKERDDPINESGVPLTRYKSILPNLNFVKCDQSFIVNISYVEVYKKNSPIAILKNKKTVNVSRSGGRRLFAALNNRKNEQNFSKID